MPSPFPGMNPYLEARSLWGSVHHRLISAISDALTAQIAPHFFVGIEERVYIIDPEDDAPDEVRDRSIELRDANGQEVITTIEVLSPRNKASRSRGRQAFLKKRHAVLASATNWIEIDLIRVGERPAEVAQQSDYYALLKRRGHRDHVAVWYVDLRDPLPVIAVPLRDPFPDAVLDLGAILADIYARGTYDLRLDYTQVPPPPRLAPADAAWAAQQIAVWRAAR